MLGTETQAAKAGVFAHMPPFLSRASGKVSAHYATAHDESAEAETNGHAGC